MANDLELWTDFSVAMVGATAALAGLVIVAASVNIGDIVKSRTLTARLGSAIVALVVALVVSAIGLVPGITDQGFGMLVLLLVAIALVFQVGATRLIAADEDRRDRARWAKSGLGFLPLVAYLSAGVLAVAQHPSALYLAAAGTVLAIVAALIVSWVALVEVLR